ncbi:MAG: DPP IV N-terminal domain-containing protein [Myxococcales bacterium]|nr:DPP IV N-terminal domain-containing protein [Myxococcales bacterium]
MRFTSVTALLLALACGGSTPSPTLPSGPALDFAFLDLWSATSGFRLGHPSAITITPAGDEVLFLRSGPRDAKRALFVLDVGTGEERVLLDADRLLGGAAETLSAEERALRERLRLSARGITSYEPSGDGHLVLVPLSGRLFVLDRRTDTVRELPSEGGYANDARLSPDGTKVACVREGDLWVIDLATNTQTRLTTRAHEEITNGLAEFVAQEEMGRYRGYWWSPGSDAIVYQETDASGVELLYASNPIDPAEAPHAARYPRAGRANALVRLGVIPIQGGETGGETGSETRWVEWDRARFPYLASVTWPSSAPLTLLVQDRRQQVAQLLAVDIATGQTSLLHEERDDAWLNLDTSVPVWLEDGSAFLWSTERSGHWQLELRFADGSPPRALTSDALGYRELLHVDEAAGEIWVLASGDPTETHVVRVPLAGGAPTPVTTTPGQHQATFEPGTATWVLGSHTLDDGPRWEVRRGDVRVALPSRAAAPPFVPRVEHVVVGERDHRAMVIRPRDFDPRRRYPVLLSVYAGPGYVKARKGRFLQLREQWQADQGFIVVSVDGRGTPHRGRAWERAVRGNLIDVPLEDQVAGLRALGARFPELDLARVGVYGWSFGGYFSAMAVMRRPDVFHAAVSGAPVADWRDYDTHYTERFMGLPEANISGYDASSVLTYAPQLTRPLLLIHGTSDDNVYFTHALKMHDALLRARRPHDFIVLAGSTHMVADAEVARALEARILGFLQTSLSR